MFLFIQVGILKKQTPHVEIFINEISITGHILSRNFFESCDFIILNPPSRTASVINRVPEVKIS